MKPGSVCIVACCGVCCTVGYEAVDWNRHPYTQLQDRLWTYSRLFGRVCPNPVCREAASRADLAEEASLRAAERKAVPA